MKPSNAFKYIRNKASAFFGNPNLKKILSVLLFFSVTILILFSSFVPKQVMLRPDEVAKRNIQSNINAVIVDKEQTRELEEKAIGKVQKVYQEDKYALPHSLEKTANFYSNVSSIMQSEEDRKEALIILIDETKVKDVVKLNHTTAQLADYLILVKPEDIDQMRLVSANLVKDLLANPLTEEALPGAYNEIDKKVSASAYVSQAKEIIKIVSINALNPNLIFNQEATDKAIKEAVEEVQPVKKTIKAGEIIVREGDRVTAEQISVLEQLGIQRTKSYPLTLFGTGIFVLLTFWLTLEFLRRYYKEIYADDMLKLLIGLIVIIVLLITRFLTIINISDQPEINALIGYLAPIGAGSMLIAILLDSRLAYFLTMIMALYVGLLTEGNQLFYVITAFVGGTVGVFRVYKLSATSDLAKSGLYIAIANIITIITLSLIGENLTWLMALTGVLIGAINGILSAVLMIGVLPYLETAFSITSMIKLLELSNPNHYLLRRLLLEAPGTYHHSLMVGNLAEASAESIGANPLLVRVGAYYHDIGKIKRPDYFIENQRGLENPHEKIAPALSALIITSHVKEGAELAREAHLPQAIIDFIEQHHGTSLAKYFYNQALAEDGDISEGTFRYEGPKPKSKEVALVMLADSVEAAVRSLQDPSPEKIKNMVQMLIKDKLDDGQLDLCDLTFKDLDIIANSFCTVLEGVYHKRIEYPEAIVKEYEKRRGIDGYSDNKPTE